MPNPIIGMVGSAVIGAGGSLIGGAMQAGAANKATEAQVRGQEKAIAAQEKQFGEQKKALEPWQEAGLEALGQIQQGIADGSFDISKYGYDELIQDPGYEFRREQSMNALDRQAARAGKLFSGDQLAGAADLAGQMASQEFGNAFARTASERDVRYNILQDVAGRGYGAATALAGVAGQHGQNIANAYSNIGAAQGQGALNAGNAWGNAIGGAMQAGQQGIGNWMTYNRLQELGYYA